MSPLTTSTPKWMRFAPARANIVIPVTARTIDVPRSGSLRTSATIGRKMMRNGIVPLSRPRIPEPRLASQWAR